MMWRRLVAWVDERLSISPLWHGFLDRRVPRGIGWVHVFGSATLFLLLLQFATGIFLTVYYVPSTQHAHASVRYITGAVPFGRFVAGVHLWSASLLVVVIGVHMLRTFVYGAYKYPREATWITGVVLLLIVLAFAFTGYLLPYDQKAYWATVVGTNIAGAAPLLGGWALRLLRGGTAIGAVTLVRFYAFHIWILPAALILFVSVHLGMVIRQGIAAPPRRTPLDLGPAAGLPRRELYERQYAVEKQAGHPFYLSILKDAIFALLLFLAVAALAIAIGSPHEAPADPNAITYVPRPEWYFLDFFQLLWYLQGRWEPLAIFLIVMGAVLALLLLPFYDRSPDRHPARRPWAMACAALAVVSVLSLTYLGARSPGRAGTGPRAAVGGAAPAGAQVFFAQGCDGCHAIRGVGGSTGPDLTRVGATRTRPELESTILHGAGRMPAFSELSRDDLNALLTYLLSLK